MGEVSYHQAQYGKAIERTQECIDRLKLAERDADANAVVENPTGLAKAYSNLGV